MGRFVLGLLAGLVFFAAAVVFLTPHTDPSDTPAPDGSVRYDVAGTPLSLNLPAGWQAADLSELLDPERRQQLVSGMAPVSGRMLNFLQFVAQKKTPTGQTTASVYVIAIPNQPEADILALLKSSVAAARTRNVTILTEPQEHRLAGISGGLYRVRATVRNRTVDQTFWLAHSKGTLINIAGLHVNSDAVGRQQIASIFDSISRTR